VRHPLGREQAFSRQGASIRRRACADRVDRLPAITILKAAKTPATCSLLLRDSFADNSASWVLGPEWRIGPASESSGHEIGYPDPAVEPGG
jgi:hypothetical protein